MFSHMPNIEKGMDVFDVNGEKIGKVDEVYLALPGETEGMPPVRSGGGMGALGDESEVGQGRGNDVLGDDSEVETTPQTDSGALGNESMVRGEPPGARGAGGVVSSSDENVAGGVEEILIAEAVVDIPSRSEVLEAALQPPYFKVEQGGILGIGAKSLYIPFSAVQNVTAGDRVTVNCAKEECDAQYGTKPTFLKS